VWLYCMTSGLEVETAYSYSARAYRGASGWWNKQTYWYTDRQMQIHRHAATQQTPHSMRLTLVTWGRDVWSCACVNSSCQLLSAWSSWQATLEVCLCHLSVPHTADHKDSTPSLYSSMETARRHPCKMYKQMSYFKHQCWIYFNPKTS